MSIALGIHEAQNLNAVVQERDGIIWVALGEGHLNAFERDITLFFSGPRAREKAERIAAAFNNEEAAPMASVDPMKIAAE